MGEGEIFMLEKILLGNVSNPDNAVKIIILVLKGSLNTMCCNHSERL